MRADGRCCREPCGGGADIPRLSSPRRRGLRRGWCRRSARRSSPLSRFRSTVRPLPPRGRTTRLRPRGHRVRCEVRGDSLGRLRGAAAPTLLRCARAGGAPIAPGVQALEALGEARMPATAASPGARGTAQPATDHPHPALRRMHLRGAGNLRDQPRTTRTRRCSGAAAPTFPHRAGGTCQALKAPGKEQLPAATPGVWGEGPSGGLSPPSGPPRSPLPAPGVRTPPGPCSAG